MLLLEERSFHVLGQVLDNLSILVCSSFHISADLHPRIRQRKQRIEEEEEEEENQINTVLELIQTPSSCTQKKPLQRLYFKEKSKHI